MAKHVKAKTGTRYRTFKRADGSWLVYGTGAEFTCQCYSRSDARLVARALNAQPQRPSQVTRRTT